MTKPWTKFPHQVGIKKDIQYSEFVLEMCPFTPVEIGTLDTKLKH